MRTLIAMLATLALCAACSGSGHNDRVYGAMTARLGESLAVLGWNTSMSNLRWQDNYVLVDVDAGPMMLLAAPTPPAPRLSRACAAYGSSVLILPEASLDAVHVSASLCTQGDINQALLYATIAVVGTHVAVWTIK